MKHFLIVCFRAKVLSARTLMMKSLDCTVTWKGVRKTEEG